MQNEIDIVQAVSARLEQGGLEFMLTGSMAMNYYAQPRMTRDIDMVVALKPKDADTMSFDLAPDGERLLVVITHANKNRLPFRRILSLSHCRNSANNSGLRPRFCPVGALTHGKMLPSEGPE